ncbi:MAG: hypothetical protein AVO39_08090 [delta proteobacterium MLS_D]|nr:MAG: hypothetical protein AVO39_08090 [delta proteobacterium MLS_D]
MFLLLSHSFCFHGSYPPIPHSIQLIRKTATHSSSRKSDHLAGLFSPSRTVISNRRNVTFSCIGTEQISEPSAYRFTRNADVRTETADDANNRP